jgi:hypothetical protein
MLDINGLNAQSLILLNSYSLTPNTTDTMGAFCRLHYHPSRNKFYVTYAARPAASTMPAGNLTSYAWREYDANMNFTGVKGTLSGHGSVAGDYAIIMIDSTYYHLSGLYKITKYDDDFTAQGTVTVPVVANDSRYDQCLNYCNGKILVGALYQNPVATTPPTFPQMTATWTPQFHLYQYNTSLTAVASPTLLTPSMYSWGSSIVFNNNMYHIVTAEAFPNFNLYVYQYDINWNYLGKF